MSFLVVQPVNQLSVLLLKMTVKRPRGRPPTGMILVDGHYTMTPERLEIAAARLESHRKSCRERYQVTQAILRREKPELFKRNGRVGRVVRGTQCTLGNTLSESPSQERHSSEGSGC